MTCAQCGEERPIKARRLCQRCYLGLRRTGHLDRYPKTGQLGRPPSARRNVARHHQWRDVAKRYEREIERLKRRIAVLEEEARSHA